MEIIFQGKQSSEEVLEHLENVIHLFAERYHIRQFREIHISVTLMDDQGEEVELVDTETLKTYQTFEVHRDGYELVQRDRPPFLKLVVDNT